MRAVTRTPPGDDIGRLVARLTDDEPLDRRTRARLVARLARLLAASGRRLVDVVVEVAPHVRVRDLPTLREHHPGLEPDALALALVASAARATAAVGAAGGVLSSIEVAAPPTLLSAPVQVAAETLLVVAIEMRMVAELHEVYGRAPAGPPAARATAYLRAWARQRGIDPFAGGGTSMTGVLTGAARRELRQRLVRRAGRNLVTVVPFVAGAVAGAALNQRETRRLGDRIIRDLR